MYESFNRAPTAPAKFGAELFIAFTAAGIYVIALTVIPRRFMLDRRRLVVENVALVGSALAMTAVGITGGATSPYVLLSFTPILFGSFFGTFRIGLATAAFSSSLLLLHTYAYDQTPATRVMGWQCFSTS